MVSLSLSRIMSQTSNVSALCQEFGGPKSIYIEDASRACRSDRPGTRSTARAHVAARLNRRAGSLRMTPFDDDVTRALS